MKRKSIYLTSAAILTAGIGLGAYFNEQSDTPRIPEHCTEFQPVSEMTAIRYGAEPVDMHLWGRNTLIDNALEDNFGLNAGLLGMTNILYIEFGAIDDEGQFSPARRMYAFEENMQPFGNMVAGVYGSEQIPFYADPMYDDDPHRTRCGQLQSVDGDYLWPGETQIMFEGTPEQVSEIYTLSLQKLIEFSSHNHKFGPLGNNSPNGNSFFGQMSQEINTQIERYGHSAPEFNPSGIDIGVQWEGEFANSELDLPSDPIELERIIANQLSQTSSLPRPLPTDALRR